MAGEHYSFAATTTGKIPKVAGANVDVVGWTGSKDGLSFRENLVTES